LRRRPCPGFRGLAFLVPEKSADIRLVCGSLREALGEWRDDHVFLLKDEVFNVDPKLKWEEVDVL
jgi:hypothetical protein